MIPPQLLIGLALAAAGAAGVWYGVAAPRIELAELQASQLEQQLSDTRETLDARTGQLKQIEQQRDQLNQLDIQLGQLRQTITRNDAAQQRLLQELRRNDQETRDWLAGTGPAALGRLYARPETTDPSEYHAAPSLSADALSAAGSPAGDRQ